MLTIVWSIIGGSNARHYFDETDGGQDYSYAAGLINYGDKILNGTIPAPAIIRDIASAAIQLAIWSDHYAGFSDISGNTTLADPGERRHESGGRLWGQRGGSRAW